MTQGPYTDFGVYCLEHFTRSCYFEIRNFKPDTLSINDHGIFRFCGLFSNGEGTTFYCTFEFNQRNYRSLLSTLPPENRDYFNRLIDLNTPLNSRHYHISTDVRISFDCILGQKQQSETYEEPHIPFTVVIFHRVEQNEPLSIVYQRFTHNTSTVSLTKRAEHLITINQVNQFYYLYKHLTGDWGLHGNFDKTLLSDEEISQKSLRTPDPAKRNTFSTLRKLKIVSKYELGSSFLCVTTINGHDKTLIHLGDECITSELKKVAD